MDFDVAVVGGGPNGLMLAAELGLRGVSVVVLERAIQLVTTPRANGLVGQVVRLMDQRGLYRGLSEAGRAGLPLPARLGLLAQRNRPVAARRFQYGGFDLDLREVRENSCYVLPVPQRLLVSLVEERCRALGAVVRRGHELTGLDADTDGVNATVVGPAGAYRLRAAYLIGCDGAHSIVRKLSGIGFRGVTSTDFVSRNAEVRLSRAALSIVSGAVVVPGHGPLRPYQFHRTGTGAFSFAPRPGGLHLVNTYEWTAPIEDDEVPMTYAEMVASLLRVLGTDLGLRAPDGPAEPILRRTAARNTRMADQYRAGRVFIAGDAAHVFTGFGGPGLNLGLTDVINLGWKLAAAVTGHAPPGLLDTYARERQPQAAQVLHQTLEQTMLLAPGAATDQLRREFATRIAEPAGLHQVVNMIAGSEPPYVMPGAAAGPLIGRLAPDLTVRSRRGRTRLAVLQRTGRPLLLDSSTDQRYEAVTRGRVDVVRGGASAPALLIRPDGYVAWAAPDSGRTTGLAEALDTWFV